MKAIIQSLQEHVNDITKDRDCFFDVTDRTKMPILNAFDDAINKIQGAMAILKNIDTYHY